MAFIAQSRVSLSYANEVVENPRKSFPAALLTRCFSLEVSSAVGQGCGKAQGPVSPGRGTDFLLNLGLPAPQPHPHPCRALHLPTVFLCRSTWQPTPVLLLENSKDGEAWWATVHGVAENWTRLSDSTFCISLVLLGRKWQPTPVFLLGESHGQRGLVCCSLWGSIDGHN